MIEDEIIRLPGGRRLLTAGKLQRSTAPTPETFPMKPTGFMYEIKGRPIVVLAESEEDLYHLRTTGD